jgi:hypothetical protein
MDHRNRRQALDNRKAPELRAFVVAGPGHDADTDHHRSRRQQSELARPPRLRARRAICRIRRRSPKRFRSRVIVFAGKPRLRRRHGRPGRNGTAFGQHGVHGVNSVGW